MKYNVLVLVLLLTITLICILSGALLFVVLTPDQNHQLFAANA